MTRLEKYAFNLLALTVSVSGIAYGWMKYLLVNDDPFAVVNHPLQPLMLHVHVAAAPALLVMFGMLLNSHVARRIGQRVPNRSSGLVSLAAIVVMSVSGYALQITTAERLRHAWVITHVTGGAVFGAAFCAHLLVSVKLWVSAPEVPRTPAA